MVTNIPFSSSYKRVEIERFLQGVAYRGFNVNTLAAELEQAEKCSYERNTLTLVTKQGKTISANLERAYLNHDQWSFARLIHRIRMWFPESTYAKDFNRRTAKLAKCVSKTEFFRFVLQQRFDNRVQENMGNLALLPLDMRQHILCCMPINSEKEGVKFLELMAWFCKAGLGESVILKSIASKQLADVINRARIFFPYLGLSTDRFSTTKPHLTRLWLDQDTLLFSIRLTHCIALRELYITSQEEKNTDIHPDYEKFAYYTGAIDNQIDDQHLQEVAKLTTLTTLKIFNNQIKGEGLIHLTSLTQLTSLQIAEAPLKSENLKYITPLTSLTFLDLSVCHYVKGDGFKYLTSLQNLKILNLICCHIGTYEEDIMKHIRQLENLNELNLSQDCTFSGKGLRYLAGHPHLSYLNLFKCFQLQPKNWQHIADIPHLTYLNLSVTGATYENELTNEVCAHLGKLQQLTTLSLDDTPETKLTSEGLKSLKSLKHFFLYRNSINQFKGIRSRIKNVDALFKDRCHLINIIEETKNMIKEIICLNNELVELKQKAENERIENFIEFQDLRGAIAPCISILLFDCQSFLNRYTYIFGAHIIGEADAHKQRVLENLKKLEALVNFPLWKGVDQIKKEILASVKYLIIIAESLIALIDFLPKRSKGNRSNWGDLSPEGLELLYSYSDDTRDLISCLKRWIKVLSFISQEPNKKIYLYPDKDE